MTPPKHELWYSLTDKKIGTSWNFLTISCRVLTKGHLHLNKAENMFKLYYYAARRYSYIVFIVAFITIYYIIGLLLFMLLSELYNIFFKQCKILVRTSVNYFQGNFFSSCYVAEICKFWSSCKQQVKRVIVVLGAIKIIR